MTQRLAAGDALVLFAEGTSTDGNRVLPLRTSLFGAVLPGTRGDQVPNDAVVQTCAVVYADLHGLPIGRAGRPLVGWYGDMEMGSHAWNLLKAGPLDVRIVVGPPVAIESFADRKALARHVESELRQSVVRSLRNRPTGEAIEVTQPAIEGARRVGPAAKTSAKWT
jgi:1-acyl-sn-glycerol-3-phosphate acyltransferase